MASHRKCVLVAIVVAFGACSSEGNNDQTPSMRTETSTDLPVVVGSGASKDSLQTFFAHGVTVETPYWSGMSTLRVVVGTEVEIVDAKPIVGDGLTDVEVLVARQDVDGSIGTALGEVPRIDESVSGQTVSAIGTTLDSDDDWVVYVRGELESDRSASFFLGAKLKFETPDGFSEMLIMSPTILCPSSDFATDGEAYPPGPCLDEIEKFGTAFETTFGLEPVTWE